MYNDYNRTLPLQYNIMLYKNIVKYNIILVNKPGTKYIVCI